MITKGDNLSKKLTFLTMIQANIKMPTVAMSLFVMNVILMVIPKIKCRSFIKYGNSILVFTCNECELLLHCHKATLLLTTLGSLANDL